MIVEKVSLQNYRNYSLTTVTLGAGVNVFFGNNAQGKTNFLESVRYMSIGKSMRTSKEKELIRWNEDRARMQAVVRSGVTKKTIDVEIAQKEKKRIRINGIPIGKMGELMGVVATVLFSPGEVGIIKNAPSDRRRFMDIALCQMSKAYFYALTKYNKILDQRNALLKTGKASDDALYVWDVQLAKEGARIAKSRAGFVKHLEKHASRMHEYVSDNSERLTLEYEGVTGGSAAEIEQKLMAQLEENREKDRKYGYTGCGIQTDDVRVEVNGIDLRRFGSQGQQRTGALSLKLAEVELHKEQTGEYPVLLLDDVFSELDVTRRQRLLEKINGIQTIITCTHFDYGVENAKFFFVKDGTVTEKPSAKVQ